jgi:hypothetical protein
MGVRALSTILGAVICGVLPPFCLAQAPSADEAAFRALYKELVEINTTRSVGSCTQAAEAMRARLLAAGIAAATRKFWRRRIARKTAR